MLKMIKGKDTVVIDKIKDTYKVVVTIYWEGKPIYDVYEAIEDELMTLIEIYEEQGYARFETPTEWKYKFIRMC